MPRGPGWNRLTRPWRGGRGSAPPDAGFSLLEALIATTLMAGAVASLARLSQVAIGANQRAQATTAATLLAVQKMEELQGISWFVDGHGVLQDAVELTPSPDTALDVDTPGYCDYFDGRSRVVGGGAGSPAGAAYVRRWAVRPLSAGPTGSLVIQVRVTPVERSTVVPLRRTIRRPAETRLIGVRLARVP